MMLKVRLIFFLTSGTVLRLGCFRKLNMDGESCGPCAKSRSYYSYSGPTAVALKSGTVLGQNYIGHDEAGRVDQWNQPISVLVAR